VVVGSLGVAVSGGLSSPLTAVLLLAPISAWALGRRDAVLEATAFALLGYGLAVLSVFFELMPPAPGVLGVQGPLLALAALVLAGAYSRIAVATSEPIIVQTRQTVAAPVGEPAELDAQGLLQRPGAHLLAELGVPPGAVQRRPLREFVAPADREALRLVLARPGAGQVEVRTFTAPHARLVMQVGPRGSDGRRSLTVIRAQAAARTTSAPAIPAVPTVPAVDTPALEATVQRERARASSAEAALANRSLYFAQMTHEFRTPLAAVMGFAELIERAARGPLDTKYREYGGLIRQGALHMQILVDDVLNLSRIEAGRFEIHLEPLDPADMVADVTRLLSPLAAQAGVQIAAKPPVDALEVEADRQGLRQVLINLLANALKATPRGGRVTVSWQADGPAVRLMVADTGPGIAPAELARLQAPFEQAGSLDKRQLGFGLGLSVVQRLTGLMRGRFVLESTVGTGTRASLVLPQPQIEVQSKGASARARIATLAELRPPAA
jgi:signal transduction histidine kinase